jgi:hypothetical protein
MSIHRFVGNLREHFRLCAALPVNRRFACEFPNGAATLQHARG